MTRGGIPANDKIALPPQRAYPCRTPFAAPKYRNSDNFTHPKKYYKHDKYEDKIERKNRQN